MNSVPESRTAAIVPDTAATPDDHWSPIIGPSSGLLLMVPLLILLAAMVGYPLVRLAIDSVTLGDGFGNYSNVVGSGTVRRVLITTVLASALVTALAVAFGALLAWYAKAARSRAAKAVIWLAVLLPVLMGTVVRNYAFVILFQPEGPLNTALKALGLGRVELLYTTPAVLIGMTYTMVPYAVLAMYSVFANFDLTLVSAARSTGASRPRTMATIVLPVVAPGLFATAAIVFAISLGFYVTPVLLGGAQSPFMALFVQANILEEFNLPLASTASVLLLAVAIVVLGLAVVMLGRRRLLEAFG